MKNRILKVITSLIITFSVFLPVPVFAETNEELVQSLTWCINEPGHPFRLLRNGSNKFYWRVRFGGTDTADCKTIPLINCFFYQNFGEITWRCCMWSYTNMSDYFLQNDTDDVRIDYSANAGETWNYNFRLNRGYSYWYDYTSTEDDFGNTLSDSKTVYYTTFITNGVFNTDNFPKNCPKVYFQFGQGLMDDIMPALSQTGGAHIYKNDFTNSSGGRHFGNTRPQDTKSITPQQRINTLIVFDLMDVDQNNYLTSEEVNNYNNTYNSNYDFFLINGGDIVNNFDLTAYFTNDDNNDEPVPTPTTTPDSGGGGSSSGGGSMQQQQQTIEEGAVQVTVNNNNELSQNNAQWIDQTINNWMPSQDQQNAFDQGIGSLKHFTQLAAGFSALMTALFGFLPSWCLTIMGLVFTLISVMIVFRLLHLFK